MVSSERVVVVMRHAKAEQVAPSDMERPLAPRGHGDAEAAGRWLAAQGVVPGHALVSAAVRTRETWEHVALGAGWTLEPELDRGLYAADEDVALDLLRLVDDDVRTVVMVGHNPTMATLTALLDDGEGDDEPGNAAALGFPTSAVAVLGFTGSWADLGPTTASVRAFHVGRG